MAVIEWASSPETTSGSTRKPQRGCCVHRSGNNGVLGKLGRCLAQTVPLGLVPEHYDRNCETPLIVLQKITGDEHPVLLTYTNQGSVETVRVQG